MQKENGRTTTTSHGKLSEMKVAETATLLDLFNTASLHQVCLRGQPL